LVEEQAARRPDAVALDFPGGTWTYAQLDRRANRLAHRLLALGLAPEAAVGLCLGRGPDAVAGLLAILKAGGVYVPLDPDHPPARLDLLLRDAGCAAVLSHRRSLDRLPGGVPALCLDDPDLLAGCPDARPPVRVLPAQLAYVIYTSGSAGAPKGVQVEHRALADLARAQLPLFGVGPADRVLQAIPLTFDASLGEVCRALAGGAALVLADADDLRPGPGLARLLRERGVTAAALTPSALAALPADADLPALRLLTVGGEACPAALAAAWGQGRRLLGGYGPTEATVGAALAESWEPGRPPPLGRPLAHVRAYVLDGRLRPVPAGVPGELYLGGSGLARGYLGRPGLTAALFVADPYAGRPGARMYRTGDRARWRADGTLEFLGRADGQLKVRGWRVEPAEVEAALRGHPAVAQAAVAGWPDGAGSARLAGYVVAAVGAQAPSAAELRGYLRGRLPEALVPSAFVALAALPRTAHGKLDRHALPPPDFRNLALDEDYEAPQTPAQKALADIWAAVLRLERVGIRHNFFELGGDSILSIQVIARANEAGLNLTPKDLFQHQTVAELAEAAEKAGAVVADQGPVTGPVPLTPIQRWFFEQDPPDPHHFNWATFLQVPHAADPAPMRQAVRHLIAHHDALRLRLVREASGWRQHLAAPDDDVPFSHTDLSGLDDEGQREAMRARATQLQTSLNLTTGPLLRVAWFDLGADRPCRVLVIAHHLVLDAVSWRLLLEDLLAVYRQARDGQPPRLPPKTTSFKEWAEKLQEFACSEALNREQPYWLDPRRAEVRPLPIDYPEGANRKDSAEQIPVGLDEAETRALTQDVPFATKVRVHDVLLTALATTLARWTGGERVLVDLEGHGREDIGAEMNLARTVGWFTTFYPLLLDLAGWHWQLAASGTLAGEAQMRVAEQLRQVPGRGIGYAVLRYLSPDAQLRERLRSLPAAQVSFNYLGQQDGDPATQRGQAGQLRDLLGPSQSRRGRRAHLVEINGAVRQGRLQLIWTYSRNLHRRATVEKAAGDFLAALRELIAHCQALPGERRTPADFPDARLSQAELDVLLERLGRPAEKPSRGEESPLFLALPGAGSDLTYAALSHHLGQDRLVCVLQPPELKEVAGRDFQLGDLVQPLLTKLRAVLPRGPYLVGGWSLGGLAAFEMAQRLERDGQRVALLALLDTSWPRPLPPRTTRLTRLLGQFAKQLGLTVPAGLLRRLPLHEQLTLVLDRAKRAARLPPGMEITELQEHLRLYQTYLRAAQRYTPAAYPGKILLVRPASAVPKGDLPGGWDKVAGDVELRVVPGDHFSMLREPHVRALAEELRTCAPDVTGAERRGVPG
jgi:amino acid adenylation domain-containing protein/non-ribosomal peptide synthase protein (TIGR01720 family)